MSVKEHRMENGSLVLVLRSGGEVVCDPSVVTGIGPDETPYPEPPAAPAGAAKATLAAPSDEDTAPVPFGDLIERVAAKEGVDPRLVRAVIHVESNYRSNARSPKGAMGLMQLMPETARQYSVVNPYDPAANIEAGVKHLKSLLVRFPRDLALAAYNAGAAAVERFHGIPPFRETVSYVARVLQLADRS
jgi:soluble lytic murein transglycosylase-like protein